MKFAEFSHNRENPLHQTVPLFKQTIDDFGADPKLGPYYDYCARAFGVPRAAIETELKKSAYEAYDWKRAAFPKKIFLAQSLKYILKILAYFGYVTLHSEKKSAPRQSCDLLIEWIETDLELRRFKKLYDLFPRSLYVLVKPVQTDARHVYRPPHRRYDLVSTLGALSGFISVGIWKVLIASLRTKTNLFPIHLGMIDRYLYYTSLFKRVQAEYLIQERHYDTSALKNALFKKHGGKSCSSIQKNIIHAGFSGFYYDIDHFFSLGDGTHQRALRQGAILRDVTPVGSMFMEYLWFIAGGRKPENPVDVVYIGVNLLDFQDSYVEYLPDFYEHFRWLARFADEHPEISVGVKHHMSNVPDPKEKAITENSRLIHMSHDFNSYEVAHASKCNLTWGSTMAYELMGNGVPCLFVDPGRRNYGYLPYDDELEPYRVTTYEQFEKKVLEMLASNGKTPISNQTFFSHDSRDVSTKIWRKLTGGVG